MAIIDSTYFIRDLSVGQGDNSIVQTNLQMFIDKYEQEYLLKLFGYAFKKLYDAGVTAPTQQRFIDIRDGKEYTNNYGVLDKWRGLREATPILKSPIANYVYYWYLRDNVSKTLGDGEFINLSEKKLAVSPEYKMARAWNEMVYWNKEFWAFMYARIDIYPEYFEDVRMYSNKNNDLYSPIY